MSPRPSLPRGLTVFTALVITAMSLTSLPRAEAVTSHRPLNDTRPVSSGVTTVDFPIEYFGLVADLPTRDSHLPDRGRAPFGEVRFRVDGRWTPWQAFDKDGAQEAGHFTGALVSVDGADAYQVRNLPQGALNWRAAAINTTDGPAVTVGHRRASAAVAAGSPTCRSRADWGADESISDWAKGQSPDFSPLQVLTVHHTAGSNDPDQDYAATMRAIYSYHVETNGWADVGYQYLVDGHGTVYEGRSSGHTSRSCLYDGGDGSDFGHETGTDEVVTGAHVGGWNTGNLGISMMGCFEPASDTCSGNTTPTTAAIDTLDGLVASLSSRHGLRTDSTVHYVSPVDGNTKDVPAVSGHRDWNATECPGETLYNQLPAIRTSTVAFRRGALNVKENAGVVRLTVTRSGNTDLPATVGYARTSGSATSGKDFALAAGTLSFAAGQTKSTIPVTVKNDGRREAWETVDVTLSRPGEATVLGSRTSMRLRIAPSDQRPDAWVSTAARSRYVGDNVFNATGYRQTRTVRARRTQLRTFFVRVYNDGNVKNTIALKGSRAKAGSWVRFYSGTTNVTSAMRSGAGWKVRLRPGAFKLVKVRTKVLRNAQLGSLKAARVSGTWTGDGTRVDLVRAVVKVVR